MIAGNITIFFLINCNSSAGQFKSKKCLNQKVMVFGKAPIQLQEVVEQDPRGCLLNELPPNSIGSLLQYDHPSRRLTSYPSNTNTEAKKLSDMLKFEFNDQPAIA